MAGISLRLALCAVMAACAAVPPQDAPTDPARVAVRGRQLNLGAGVRSQADDDLGSLDDQAALVLDYCEPIAGPLRLEGGLQLAHDDSAATLSTSEAAFLHTRAFEVSVGLNVSQLLGPLRPYLGFGGSLVFLDVRGLDEQDEVVFDDGSTVVGTYWKGGLLLQVTPTSHLGVEFRHLEGSDASFDGRDLDTDYDQFLFVFGTSFP